LATLRLIDEEIIAVIGRGETRVGENLWVISAVMEEA